MLGREIPTVCEPRLTWGLQGLGKDVEFYSEEAQHLQGFRRIVLWPGVYLKGLLW